MVACQTYNSQYKASSFVLTTGKQLAVVLTDK
jgi:hypothetical protein